MVNKTHRELPAPGSIKARILVAAKAEFAQYGFEGARMQRVADRAALPKPNIHYHFKSKQQLYLACFRAHYRILEPGISIRSARHQTQRKPLEAFIRQKLRQAQQDPGASRLFANEMIQGAPNLKHYLNTSMRAWVQDRATGH
jgi:TetR/AcrR family transcriptional regulator